jgi:hypothetical protein
MLHTQLAALALTVTAIAASGCGSSKSGTTATTAASTTTAPTTTPAPATHSVTLATGKPLSRGRWIAAGDAICERTQDKIETLASRKTPEFAAHLPQAALYYLAEAEDLAKIVPPHSKANDWKQLVNDVYTFSQYTSEAIPYINAHGKLSPTTIAQTAAIQRSMISIGTRDGFKWCSQGE